MMVRDNNASIAACLQSHEVPASHIAPFILFRSEIGKIRTQRTQRTHRTQRIPWRIPSGTPDEQKIIYIFHAARRWVVSRHDTIFFPTA